MGIARFYRFLSERYPLINEALEGDAESFPEFDNLYLDLNGVIHNCSHGNDPSRPPQSNEEIFLAVFQYVNRLVQNIRPRKLLYLAVDGVAPRAKMNQQRSRRFRSAAAAASAAAAPGAGAGGFDSNQITPGTEFMEELTRHLAFFVSTRLEEDPLWRSLEVVLSGPEVPGEGEHKIMDFIRTEKFKARQQLATGVSAAGQFQTVTPVRHCLYGLDADLIMLGLTSHEPHFSLLREEVVFGGSSGAGGDERILVKKDKFQLLHLGVLREYLALEFARPASSAGPGEQQSQEVTPAAEQELDRMIDDFILICFLIGNDFLPHLPLTEVSDGGLDRLFSVYKQICLGLSLEDDGLLGALGGAEGRAAKQAEEARQPARHLTHSTGLIEWENLERFLAKYAELEDEALAETVAKGEWVVGQRRFCGEHPKSSGFEDWFGSNGRKKGSRNLSLEQARGQYYAAKFENATAKNGRMDIYKEYLKGLQWNLFYYFRGVQDWSWFYPFFAAPFIGDLVYDVRAQGLSLKEVASSFVKFQMGTPFSPFEQLMGVLPASSGRKFLPHALSRLMTENQEIKEFYPKFFEVDMDGVRVEWGGIVLLPFVEERKLVVAVNAVCNSSALSEAEKKRNATGVAYIFRRAKQAKQGRIESSMPSHLPSIEGAISVEKEVFAHAAIPEGKTFPNQTFDFVVDRKFPSMLRFPVVGELMSGFGVKVFGRESRNASLVVILDPLTDVDVQKLPALADKLIDRKLQVDFPFVHVGTVRRLLGSTAGYLRDRSGKIEAFPRSRQEHDWDFNEVCASLRFRGVAVEPRADAVLVELSDGSIRLATVVRELVGASDAGSGKKQAGEEQLFVADSTDALLGCLARKISDGKFRATGDKGLLSDLSEVVRGDSQSDQSGSTAWRNVASMAKTLNLHPGAVQALLGSFPVRYRGDREDLGLRLFIQRGGQQKGGSTSAGGSGNLCCVGFSRLERQEWQFSERALALLQEYLALNPKLSVRLAEFAARRSSGGLPAAKDLFDGDVDKQIGAVTDFIKKKVKTLPHVPVTHEALDAQQVKLLEELLQQQQDEREVADAEYSRKQLVTREELLKRFSVRAKLRTSGLPKVGSRVRVYVPSVPSGARGTVVAVYAFSDGAIQLEVLLDKKTLGAESLHGRCSNLRGVIVAAELAVVIATVASLPASAGTSKRPSTAAPKIASPRPPQASDLPLPSFAL